jgi:aspartate/methionine/tyrosine aminotransferase
VLVPSPSYPLFSYLCDVEGVRARSYPLLRDEAFRIDVGAIARAVGERTRAVVVVHPNNPTGTFARRDDAEALDALAAERGLVIVSDEVFADYPFGPLKGTKLPTFAGPRAALTFVLSGLSKVACAPQLKLGWTSVHGDDEAVRLAMSRLEVIADTFLSVSTPVQVALPAILERVPRIQEEVLARLRENLAAIDRAIEARGPHAPVRRLDADGGWSALLEVARTRTEDEWASSLLREHGVIVQPGYFYDMDREGFLVVSLLPEPERFRAGIERVVDVLARA